MNHIFDPLNIFILAVAVIVFWRLSTVLGRRTGNERPPVDPFAPREKLEKKLADGAVPERPNRRHAEPAPANIPVAATPAPPVWEGFASADSAVAQGLEKIATIDRQFSPSAFLEGAKTAYEMIVTAFAAGDKQTLKPLLSREVYEGFARAIDQRRQAGENLETSFVGIDAAELVAPIWRARGRPLPCASSASKSPAGRTSPVISWKAIRRRFARSPIYGLSSGMYHPGIRIGRWSPPGNLPRHCRRWALMFCLAILGQPLIALPMTLSVKLEPVGFADMTGWGDDDHREALAVFVRSCEEISQAGRGFVRQSTLAGDRSDWLDVCTKAIAMANGSSTGAARKFFEKPFQTLPRR